MKKMKFSIKFLSSVPLLILFVLFYTNANAQVDLNSIDVNEVLQNVHQKGNGKHVSILTKKDLGVSCEVSKSVSRLNDSTLDYLGRSEALQSISAEIARKQNNLHNYHGKIHAVMSKEIQMYEKIRTDIENGSDVQDAAVASFSEYQNEFITFGLAPKVEARLIKPLNQHSK